MMRSFILAFFCTWQVLCVAGVSITAPENVVAGREIALKCNITRGTGDRNSLRWYQTYRNETSIYRIYSSRACNSSIPLSPSSPAGLSGGCQHVNGEEVYTVTIENVTEDTGRVVWTCQYGNESDFVTLDVKVMVTQVTMTNPPDEVLAGFPGNFTCVTSASKPQACIRGYIRSSGNVREIDPPADCNQDSISVQTTTRTLTFSASAEENGAELYCNASNSVTDPPVRSQLHTLSVQSIPSHQPLVGAIAGSVVTALVLVIVAVIITVLVRRRRLATSGTDRIQSLGQRIPPNHQEMTENSSPAPVYNTLNLSPPPPGIPIYVNPVPSPAYENTSTSTTENDSTAYERLGTIPAPMLGTNRLYGNTIVPSNV